MALKLSSTQYAHIEGVVSQDENTFVGWFAPSFLVNDGNQRYFFDVDNLDYSLRNTGSANTFTTTADGRTYDFTAPSWSANDWIHVAYAFQKSGDIHKVWVNGTPLVSSGDGGSWGVTTVDLSDRLFVGKQASSGGTFAGKSAEVAVYNRMLTDSEVLLLSKAFSPIALPFRDDLIGYWDFIRPGTTQSPRFGEMPAIIVGSPAIEDHPRVFYSTSQHLFEPRQPLSPPVIGRISETYYAGTGSNQSDMGIQDWITPENIDLDDEQYATITVDAGSVSKILKSREHNFNIPPQGIIEGVQIEVQFNFDKEFLNIFQLFDGLVYGSPVGQVVVGGSGSALVVYGDNTEQWGLTLTPTKINSDSFGFGFIVHDTNTTSPTIEVDFIRITVHWSSVGAVTYTEEPVGGLLGGGIGGVPFRSGTGGAVSGGTATPTSEEAKIPTGGASGGGFGIPTPHLIGDYGTELEGGLSGGTTANWNIAPGVSGGSLGGGEAIKGFSSPLASSGLFAGGEADVMPIFGMGGIILGGVAEDDSRTPIGGAVSGSGDGVEVLFEYTAVLEGGLSAGGTFNNDTYTEEGLGGTLGSGSTIPRPHFIGEYGDELDGGVSLGGSITINGDPEGGSVLGTTAEPTIIYTFIPTENSSVQANGTATQRFIDFVSGSGGTLGGGTADSSLTVAVFGGGVVGNSTQVEFVERNPSVSGGAVVSGDIKYNFFYANTDDGGASIGGASPFEVGRDFLPDGNSNSGAGIIFQPNGILNPTVHINANGSFTGSTITVGGESDLSFVVRFKPSGIEITIGGRATPVSATYLGTEATGGITLTGYSAAWFIRKVEEPRILDALCMKSDNIYKDMYLTTETQLTEEFACGAQKNPVLCKVDFSAKVLQQNKVQGAFLPTATVIRQRQYLPTPKQEARSRSNQLASS